MFTKKNKNFNEPQQQLIDKETLAMIQKAYNIDERGKEIFPDNIQNNNLDDNIDLAEDEVNKLLNILLQNASNTDKFFKFLYEESPTKHKQIIKNIISNTKNSTILLKDFYKHILDKEFLAEKKIINTNLNYQKSLLLAIEEEILSLNEYIKLFDHKIFKKRYIDLNKLMIYKICNISYLQLLRTF